MLPTPRAQPCPAHLGSHPALLTLWDRARPSWTTLGCQLLIKGVLWKPLCPRTCDHLLQDRLYHFHSEMAFMFTLAVSYLKTSSEIVPICD